MGSRRAAIAPALLVLFAALAFPGNAAAQSCPLSFTATPTGAGAVQFHWSGFGGAEGYQVFGRQGQGNTAGYSPMLSGDARDYARTGIASGPYVFWVDAWHSGTVVAESCQVATTIPGSFTVTFTGVKGNEWWEEAKVQGNVAVTGVEVILGGGSAHALTLRSWGSWAGSFHAPAGTLVQFVAHDAAGDTAASACYHWTDAAPASCSTGPPPATAVSYYGLKGNAWWIEARTASKSPVAGVDARVDGGTWVAMTLRSWGAWAVSTHAPEGSHVQLRARLPDGTYAFVPNGWTWTSATAYPGPADAPHFANVKGNAHWVQVNVYASASDGLGSVAARVNGGAWTPLKLQAWGDWAASVPAPAGSSVQFQACGSTCHASGTYAWPPA